MNTEIDPIALALMLGALAMLPALLLCTTCFLKVSIVLSIVRNAIGVQQVPPGAALYSIALATTLLVMAPTFKQMRETWPDTAAAKGAGGSGMPKFSLADLATATEPLRAFMVKNTSVAQRERFRQLVGRQWPAEMAKALATTDYVVLVPAFVVSELQLAFEVGFLLYVPFVVIDLLISNLLLALGMQIMLVNLIGGLGVGIMQRGLSASESMRVYSMLTIGDGLVTQVPALLTSLTAGLLVTKSGGSGADAPNLGRKLAEQLFAQPKAWVTASGVIFLLGLIPGMPMIVFGAVAAMALGFGLNVIRKELAAAQSAAQASREMVQDVREFELVSPLSLAVSERLHGHPDRLRLVNVARQVRNNIVAGYGMMLPRLDVELHPAQSRSDIALCQNDVAVFELEISGTQPLTPEWWTAYEQQVKSALFEAAPRAFGVQDAQHLMDWVAKLYPQLHKELEGAVPVGRFAEVLQRLIAEQVSIRNLKLIAQALVEAGQRERDPAMLTEHVRWALSREICAAHAEHGVLSAFILDVELESAIRDAIQPTAHGQLLAFHTQRADPVLDQLAALLRSTRLARPVILCSEDVRPYVRRIFAQRFFLVPVIALGEATANCRFEIKGVLELHPTQPAAPDALAPVDAVAHHAIGGPAIDEETNHGR